VMLVDCKLMVLDRFRSRRPLHYASKYMARRWAEEERFGTYDHAFG